MSYKKTVCVDFDGVLCRYDGWKGEDHFGEPLPGALEFMRLLYGVAKVVVFTTRTKADTPGRPEGTTPESLALKVKQWLYDHGMPYHEVYVGQGKPLAAAYVDDRAVGIPTNPTQGDFEAALFAVSRLLK